MATSTLGSGTLVLAGTTSGTTTLQATAVAGTTTLTLPAATDTLVGRATTDTLTNKTLTSPTLTGVATFDAGTAALPAITTTGDTNTGIFFPAADTIAISTAGAEVARFDSAGNFGLGVTPSAWASNTKALQLTGASFNSDGASSRLWRNCYTNGTNIVYTANGTAERYESYGGAHYWYNAASGTAGNAISFTQAMTLDTSGNLLVGVTSSSASHKFVGKTANEWAFTLESSFATANQNYGQIFYFSAAAPNNTTVQFLLCTDNAATRMYVNSNGGIANYSANDVNLSDRREKTNFAPAGSYLDKICAIPVQTFNYIDQNLEEDSGLTLGVVAQDMQAIAPELVMESNWGTKEEPKMRLSIYQTDLQYALMKCIQEQQAIIQTLTARITALESA